jgi:hypothetical protein
MATKTEIKSKDKDIKIPEKHERKRRRKWVTHKTDNRKQKRMPSSFSYPHHTSVNGNAPAG